MPRLRAEGSDLRVGRILHEDDDLITIEVGKRDDVTYTLDPDTPDRFLTLLFVRNTPEGVRVWTPWEGG